MIVKEELHKKELRCENCHKLLGYIKSDTQERFGKRLGIEIKCARCKTVNNK
jgi:phage FluMu protein Com